MNEFHYWRNGEIDNIFSIMISFKLTLAYTQKLKGKWTLSMPSLSRGMLWIGLGINAEFKVLR